MTQLSVVVDVQHLYRPERPGDQGSIYHLSDGTTITEAHCASLYAAGIHAALAERGAQVITNDAAHGILTGPYSRRGRWASLTLPAPTLYLACHLNAGRGSYARLEMMAAHPDDLLRGLIGNELVVLDPSILTCQFENLSPGERGAVCIEFFSGPALLLEPFFGDNPAQQHLMTPANLALVGQAIARGVLGWWARQRL